MMPADAFCSTSMNSAANNGFPAANLVVMMSLMCSTETCVILSSSRRCCTCSICAGQVLVTAAKIKYVSAHLESLLFIVGNLVGFLIDIIVDRSLLAVVGFEDGTEGFGAERTRLDDEVSNLIRQRWRRGPKNNIPCLLEAWTCCDDGHCSCREH